MSATEPMEQAAIRRFYRNLGARVRTARQHAGLTQDELAAQIGVSRPSIANLETGRQRIPVHLLTLIVATCDIPVAELLAGPAMWEQSDSFFNLDEPLADETDSTRTFVEATLRSLDGPGDVHVES